MRSFADWLRKRKHQTWVSDAALSSHPGWWVMPCLVTSAWEEQEAHAQAVQRSVLARCLLCQFFYAWSHFSCSRSDPVFSYSCISQPRQASIAWNPTHTNLKGWAELHRLDGRTTFQLLFCSLLPSTSPCALCHLSPRLLAACTSPQTTIAVDLVSALLFNMNLCD